MERDELALNERRVPDRDQPAPCQHGTTLCINEGPAVNTRRGPQRSDAWTDSQSGVIGSVLTFTTQLPPFANIMASVPLSPDACTHGAPHSAAVAPLRPGTCWVTLVLVFLQALSDILSVWDVQILRQTDVWRQMCVERRMLSKCAS